MKIKSSQLRHIITSMLLNEGKADEIIEKHPELKPAYDAGIKNPQYLNWLRKYGKDEPIEDIVPVIKAFSRSKNRLKSKKKSPDIYAYKSANEIRQTLESLGKSRSQKKKQIKADETTFIGEFGDWIVAMPHTTESSCQLGKGTTWCTAATQSGNMFLNYVARKDQDIILYYVIRKGVDSTQNPNAKLSLGFVNGNLVARGERGGLTVNAKNEGLTEEKIKSILGEQYGSIVAALKSHAASISGQHPAKGELLKLSKDVNALTKKLESLGPDEAKDLANQVLRLNPSLAVFKAVLNAAKSENEKKNRSLVLFALRESQSLKLSPDEKGELFDTFVRFLNDRPNIGGEGFIKRLADKIANMLIDYLHTMNLPSGALRRFFEAAVAISEDSLLRLFSPTGWTARYKFDKDAEFSDFKFLIDSAVASNSNTLLNYLARHSAQNYEKSSISKEVIQYFVKLLSNSSVEMTDKVKEDIASSIILYDRNDYPSEVYQVLAKLQIHSVSLELARNPNISFDTWLALLKSKDSKIKKEALLNRFAISSNFSTSELSTAEEYYQKFVESKRGSTDEFAAALRIYSNIFLGSKESDGISSVASTSFVKRSVERLLKSLDGSPASNRVALSTLNSIASASNPNVMPEVLGLYAKHSDSLNSSILGTVVSNKLASEETVAKIAQKNPDYEQFSSNPQNLDLIRAFAKNPNSPPDLLNQIGKNAKSPVALQILLSNPSTPQSTIRNLFESMPLERASRRAGPRIIHNPNAPSDILVKIFENAPSVRERFADELYGNPNLPDEYAEKLEAELSHKVSKMTRKEAFEHFHGAKFSMKRVKESAQPAQRVTANKRNLLRLIKEEYQKILLEGKADKLIEKHPELKTAYDKTTKKNIEQNIASRNTASVAESLLRVLTLIS